MKKKFFFRQDDGVAATEFALIVPILATVLMGIIDYGSYINSRMKLEDVSRSAAQYIVQGGSQDDVQAAVIETSGLYTELTADGQEVTVTAEEECECSGGVAIACAGTCDGGEYMRRYYAVAVESTYSTMFPYPGIDDTMTLTGYSRLQIE